jgi:tryptophanyl-tRNA synthetase
VAKRITFSTARAVFGFDNSTNIGCILLHQHPGGAARSWSRRSRARTFPALIPSGIDQDPHFRVARDIAPDFGLLQSRHCSTTKMFPGLQGTDKMSPRSRTAL